MKNIGVIGRILYALPFGVFAVIHFIMGPKMAGVVPVPFWETVWVYLVGVALALACISMLINQAVRTACILLGIMLFIFVLWIHLPAVINAGGFPGGQVPLTMLLKDLALGGAAWFIAGHAAPADKKETKTEAEPQAM